MKTSGIIILLVCGWSAAKEGDKDKRGLLVLPRGGHDVGTSAVSYSQVLAEHQHQGLLGGGAPAHHHIPGYSVLPFPVKVAIPVPVDRPVPVAVPKPYPIPVVTPVPYYLEKPVPVPVKVPLYNYYKVPVIYQPDVYSQEYAYQQSAHHVPYQHSYYEEDTAASNQHQLQQQHNLQHQQQHNIHHHNQHNLQQHSS